MLRDDFLSYMELQRRCSPLTLRNYSRDLELFVEWLQGECGEGTELETATTELIREWIIYRMEGSSVSAPLSASSMNRALATLRSTYSWGEKRGYITRNPLRAIKALKATKPLPHFIPQKAMKQLLEKSPKEESQTPEWIEERNTLIIETLYFTGLRLSEIASLSRDSFSADFKTLRVMGKGQKERIIPILEPLQQKILSHLAKINQLNIWKNQSNCLFLSKQGKPLSTSMIYKIVKSELSKGDVEGRKSPHILRHTFATHILNRGGDIRVIQELLGHTSLQATQRYTHNSIATLRASYNNAHPRGDHKVGKVNE